jgi:hypothetical protein
MPRLQRKRQPVRPPATAVKAEFGPAGREVIEFLKNLDPRAFDETAPLSRELARLADSLAEVRAGLRDPSLTVLELTRLRTLEHKLSETFRKTWRELGLSEEGAIYGTPSEKIPT